MVLQRHFPLRRLPLSLLVLAGLVCASAAGATQSSQPAADKLPDEVTDSPLLNSRFILFGAANKRDRTLKWIARRGKTDMVAPLIYALRYSRPEQREQVALTLEKITRRRYGDDWFRWMQWQQANPEIKPFAGFDIFLSALFGSLDPGFKEFIYPGVKHDIRLEEIVWGGVRSKEGIPPLDHPKMIEADAADYLDAGDFVFGVAINGDVRAYPYRIMDWHEMLNDRVGGVPVSLAYCTLCGSGILYATQIDGRAAPLEFGSSGLLYQSNKLMFDKQTSSLWNQFTGRPAVGELVGSGLQMKTLPLVSTTWGKWLGAHPDSMVLDIDTGFTRDYQAGKAYGRYFKSSALMFPTLTDDRRLRQKEQVFGLRMSGANRAWPLRRFRGGKVINDQVGVINVVLIGDEASRTVRAYRRGDLTFARSNGTGLNRVRSGDALWSVEEHALVGPQGRQLTRLPGHLAFWFAWHNYLGGDTLSEDE